MVQINLPKNSKVKKGKYYKDTTESKNIRKVNIYRWDPSSGENPRIDTYEVDMDNCPSKVLDLLNKIKGISDRNALDSVKTEIFGKKGIISAYKTGRGSIKIRAKIHIETKGKDIIVIDELPYQVNKSR